METCKNCGAEFDGTFCPQCGQRKNQGRIVLREAARDVLEKYFDLDTPLFRTIRDLFIRPGTLIRNYIFGQRKKYAHPFRYFILVTAIYLIIKSLTGFDPVEAFSQAMGASEMPNPRAPGTKASDFYQEHINSLSLIFVLTLAFFSRLFFRKSGFYFVEYLALSFYTISQYLLILNIIVPFSLLSPKIFLLNYIIVFVYPIYVLVSFHKGNIFWRTAKSILIVLLAWPLYAMLGFMISQLIVTIFAL